MFERPIQHTSASPSEHDSAGLGSLWHTCRTDRFKPWRSVDLYPVYSVFDANEYTL
jgi:hypothetical protein